MYLMHMSLKLLSFESVYDVSPGVAVFFFPVQTYPFNVLSIQVQ